MLVYADLIEQTFEFPTEEFSVVDNRLQFHGVPLMDIIEQYGTPLKITYIPKIGEQIEKARRLFTEAMAKFEYEGKYTYCYCTKSSHFRFVLEEALAHGVHLETSSAFDIPIIRELHRRGLVDKDMYIICNGFKRPLYMRYISEMINDGFTGLVPILDNISEIDYYEQHVKVNCPVGIRVAADEEPNFEFYTSRLGIRYNDVVDFYKKRIEGRAKFRLSMLHFFINTGMKDTAYYWSELAKFIELYCELRKICPELTAIDIGGGLPIKNSLAFDFDYQYMIEQIIENIKYICDEQGVPTPDIITEFGSFTVGEAGAMIYSILDQKQQNDKELWYMVDSSFITTLPDIWGLNQKYIMMPINHWDRRYHQVNLGGLTCDSMDYYNSEAHTSVVFLPRVDKDDPEPLYVGFFHTGAYQETLGGYGGIQHCLIPAPKHVLIDRNPDGTLRTELFAEEQAAETMLSILGY